MFIWVIILLSFWIYIAKYHEKRKKKKFPDEFRSTLFIGTVCFLARRLKSVFFYRKYFSCWSVQGGWYFYTSGKYCEFLKVTKLILLNISNCGYYFSVFFFFLLFFNLFFPKVTVHHIKKKQTNKQQQCHWQIAVYVDSSWEESSLYSAYIHANHANHE